MTKRKLSAIILSLMAALCLTSAVAFADEGETGVTTWANLYKGLIGSEVSTAEGYYDAVSSATKIAPNVHYRHIPAVVNKVETIENGKAVEAILDGVKLTGKDAKVTPKVGKVEWNNFATAAANKKYGTDELCIYPDDTVEGYTWDDYLTNMYAVTVSDGKTTAGALPWVDFYGELSTSGPHYNKVEIALNTGMVATGELGTQSIVHRFDAFYTDGVLNPGIYTVTVYSEGYTPLTAEVKVPTVTKAKASVENADVSATSTKVTIEGLESDYDAAYYIDGTEAAYADGAISFSGLSIGNHTLTVKDKKEKYNDITADFLITTEEVMAAYDGTALVAADGVSEEKFAAYLSAIQSVTVDGTSYAATGRRAVKVITADGKIDLSKTASAESTENVTVIVTAPGYPEMQFTILSEATKEARSAAEAAADKASKMDTSKYTAASAAAITKALEDLNALLADSSATADQINAAKAALDKAVSNAEVAKKPAAPTKPVTKKANPMKASAKTLKVKFKKLKKKNQVFAAKKAFTVTKAQGKVTYKVTKKDKKAKNKITVSKAGKVTVKKGLKKGKYIVTVKITAAGKGNYKAGSKVVTLVVKVK